MTAGPFVSTITKPPAAAAVGQKWGSCRRVLLLLAVLVPVLMAVGTLIYVIQPKCDQQRIDQLQHAMRNNVDENTVEYACTLRADPGKCRGAFVRYYYDVDTGNCKDFLFGGCNDGNENNFATQKECENLCRSTSFKKAEHPDVPVATPEICQQPLVVGGCRASFRRYGFNSSEGKCVQFTYGGCDANDNNFQSVEECETACPVTQNESDRSAPSVDCSSEKVGGECMAYLERYAFNPTSQRCEKFVYGGCGGNGNRYDTEDQCMRTCGSADRQLVVGQDYDTMLCGGNECPQDCGEAARQGDCVYCKCAPTPFLSAGEIAVRRDEPCPPGYGKVRDDFANIICAEQPVPADAS